MKNAIGIFLFLLCLLFTKLVSAQYIGSSHSGFVKENHIWLACDFYKGGSGNGSAYNIKMKDIVCNSFFGESGSGSVLMNLDREIDCHVYFGDSSSGHYMYIKGRDLECSMYLGNSHSGHYMEFYFNPSKCLMYTASLQGGSGFNLRALSDDTLVCEIIPLGVDVSPLMVELIDNMAVLSWYTEREYRNSGFELYRSYDGLEWELISWKSGKGDSDKRVDYQHVDKKLNIKGQYYRYKQIDFDGVGYYSNIVQVGMETKEMEKDIFTIFPNPTFSTGTLSLKSWNNHTKDMSLEIIDAMGRVVYNRDHTFSREDDVIHLPVDKLNPGSYFIKLVANDDDMEMTLPFVIVY